MFITKTLLLKSKNILIFNNCNKSYNLIFMDKINKKFIKIKIPISIFIFSVSPFLILKTNFKNKHYLSTIYKQIENLFNDLDYNFFVDLELIGGGFKFLEQKKNTLFFDLAYSHHISIELDKGVSLVSSLNDGTLLTFSGNNRLSVLNFGEKVRKLRRPSVYIGTGIKFLNEEIKRKERKKDE